MPQVTMRQMLEAGVHFGRKAPGHAHLGNLVGGLDGDWHEP